VLLSPNGKWPLAPPITILSISFIKNDLAGHYAVGDYVTEEAAATKLRLMNQDLYFEFVNIVVRKGSPYLARLNKFLLRLMDSGLILKWEQQVRYTSAGPVPKWRASKIAPRHRS
jgi:hypothetical protein